MVAGAGLAGEASCGWSGAGLGAADLIGYSTSVRAIPTVAAAAASLVASSSRGGHGAATCGFMGRANALKNRRSSGPEVRENPK